MAFRFVLGRAGSGKTAWCLGEISQRLASSPEGAPLILLVPEQATHQAEVALVNAPGIRGSLRAQVLSFRRLAWRVMQEVGGTTRLPIDDTGKRILLHSIIHNERDKLRSLRSSAEQLGLVEQLSGLFSEMKRYCISSDALGELWRERHGESLWREGLSDKLHDVQLLYHAFETELSQLYLDGEDYLALLAAQLEQSAYACGAVCWVDGFHGFTPQEQVVLEKLAVCASEMTVTLCLDRDYAPGSRVDELDLFHPTARTLLQLKQRLADRGVETEPPVCLPSGPTARFRSNPMLAHLERHWNESIKITFAPSATDRFAAPGIHVSAAVNRRAEVDGVAREIVRLVREDGLRWRDIAVTTRDAATYGDLLTGAFADLGIPYFCDQKRSVLHHPIVELIRSALEAIATNWAYDPLFRCVKTGFFAGTRGSGPDASDIPVYPEAYDQLENYVLAFGIRGSRWTAPEDWTYSYRTSLEQESAEATAADQAFLRLMNECRRRVAAPLAAMQERMKRKTTVQNYVEALYDLLVALEVPEQLERWSRRALEEGNAEKAREHAQVWDRMIDVFDQLVELLGERPMTLKRFSELIETGLESIRLGLVPPTLDQVLIGSMDRTRLASIKHMFVVGVNDGVLPAKMPDNGLFSENEREQLAATGLTMAEGGRRRLLDEAFLIYTSFCAPSAGLWLSYSLADEEGRTLLPSDVLRQLKRMFPTLKERLLANDPQGDVALTGQLDYIERPGKALSLLMVQLKQWMKGAPMNAVWWSVYNWFARQPEHRDRLARLVRALVYTNRAAPLGERTSRLLYGTQIQTSVSRMERFVACPFSQFSSHGLRLQERRIYRLAAPDIGQLFHAALSAFAERTRQAGLDWGAMPPDAVYKEAGAVIEWLSPRLQGEILLSSMRYGYIARKLTQVVGQAALMLGEHARRGQFQPIGLEVGFGRGQTIPPLAYELPGGVSMELRGRIDRVDRADTERGTLLRVIDYKSSAKALSLGDVYYGLSLQMLAYLDVILTHAPVWLGTEAIPAGVLYFHVHNPVLSASNRLGPEAAAKEMKKRFKMRGLLRDDAEIVRLMDASLNEAGHSELLPAALKADGTFYKTSSVATEGQWNSLRRYVRRTIRDAGASLTAGCIDIAPYQAGQATACMQCAFRSVCQFDQELEGNAYRMLPALSRETAMQRIESRAAADSADRLDDPGPEQEEGGERNERT